MLYKFIRREEFHEMLGNRYSHKACDAIYHYLRYYGGDDINIREVIFDAFLEFRSWSEALAYYDTEIVEVLREENEDEGDFEQACLNDLLDGRVFDVIHFIGGVVIVIYDFLTGTMGEVKI